MMTWPRDHVGWHEPSLTVNTKSKNQRIADSEQTMTIGHCRSSSLPLCCIHDDILLMLSLTTRHSIPLCTYIASHYFSNSGFQKKIQHRYNFILPSPSLLHTRFEQYATSNTSHHARSAGPASRNRRAVPSWPTPR